MKKTRFLWLVLALVMAVASLSSCDFFGGLFGGGSSNEELTVIDNGQTDYALVIAEGASKDEQNLANYIASVSGAELQSDASPEAQKEILIGKTNRKATDSIASKLTESASAVVIQFVIAESDGKVVILADDEIGYFYALDYFKTKCISDGKFSLQSGAYDIQSVFWDDYYASDEYYNRLQEENENNKPDGGTGDGNKPGSGSGDGLLTVEQMIEQYKNLSAAFNQSSFGNYSASTFIEGNKQGGAKRWTPSVYPDEAHPRLYFTKDTIDEVRKNLTHPQNAYAYKRYIALSDSPCDGIFPALTGGEVNNYDYSVAAKLEAKALRYAMTGEEIYGREAIYAAKNAMLTIDVRHSVSDWCRTYGHLMHAVACVYDWCYDLLTEADKAHIIAGCVNILGYEQEICGGGDGGLVPVKQGAAYGHGAEDQLLVNYLSFAIACYGDASEIYELAAGRILTDYTAMQNYIGQSGTFWEGSMYGSGRGNATIVSNILFNRMNTAANAEPFEESYIHNAIISSTYWIRPDGHVFRMGDMNENNTGFQFYSMVANCFYAGNMYNDPYLKNMAYKYLKGFSQVYEGAGLSAIQFLCVNDPDVSYEYNDYENLSLSYTSTYPYTTIFAKSEHNNKNAYGVFMTMNEMYVSSHAHAEAGSFQIFYKGALVSDSGAYSDWGGTHGYGYQMDSISANTVLVFNQNIAKEWKFEANRPHKNMTYTGGQLLRPSTSPFTLDAFLTHPALGSVKSLGNSTAEKDGNLVYTYIGGDLTDRYDADTVDEVSRYMISVATGDNDRPYAHIVFDRIVSDDASYHKSSLIHVQAEPTVTNDGFVIVTNTEKMGNDKLAGTSNNGYQNNGKLVLQTVGFDTEYAIVGGAGKEFWIPGLDENGNYSLEAGENRPHSATIKDGSLEEFGWGRVEISPAKETEAKKNYILSVMYVTDADNDQANVKAIALSSAEGKLTGTEIFGKAVFFPKDDKFLDSSVSFTLETADTCYVTGVKDGTWEIRKDGALIDTVTVEGGRTVNGSYTGGEHIITFAAGAGNYTLTPVN